MKFLLYACVTICYVLVSGRPVFCQEEEAITTTDKIFQFPDKLFSKLNGKAAALNKALDRQTERYLTELSKQEVRLRNKITARDPPAGGWSMRLSKLYIKQLFINDYLLKPFI